MYARVQLPSDPLERRRLWREWIQLDTPAADRNEQAVRCRRVESKPAEVLDHDWIPKVLHAPDGVIDGLKRAISECLIGDILPISDRERLIRRSIRLGLNRFEANLLIAAVQNRARQSVPVETDRFVSVAEPGARQWTTSRLAWLLATLLFAELIGVIALARAIF